MIRDEIKLVAFILCALVAGAAAKWWNDAHPFQPAPPPPPQSGWAKPPYVFKSRKEREHAVKDLEKRDAAQK